MGFPRKGVFLCGEIAMVLLKSLVITCVGRPLSPEAL